MQSVSIICMFTLVIKGALSQANLYEPFQRDVNSYCDANFDGSPVGTSVMKDAADPNQEYLPSYSSDNVFSKSKREPPIQDESSLGMQGVESNMGEADQFDPLTDVANQMMFESSNPMVYDTRDSLEPMQQAPDESRLNSEANSNAIKYSDSLMVPDELRLKHLMEFNSNGNSPKLSRSRRADPLRMGLNTQRRFMGDLDSNQEPMVISRKLAMLRNKPISEAAHNAMRETRRIEGKKRRSLMYGINNEVLPTSDPSVPNYEKTTDSVYNIEFSLYNKDNKCGCTSPTTKCTTPCTTKCTPATTPCTTKCTPATTPCTTKCTPATTPCTTKCTPATTPCTTKCTPATTPCTTKCTTPCPKRLLA